MRHHHFGEDHPKRPFALRVLRTIGLVVGGVVLAALFALVLAIIVQWLWNWLMPDIFNLKQITFWQAFGLIFLSRLLFGTLRHGHHGRPRFGRRHHERFADHWRRPPCGTEDEDGKDEESKKGDAGAKKESQPK
jgi:hypothetical protein